MADVNLYSFLAVFALQCLGAFEHWRLQKKQGRVQGNFWTYLTADHPTNSVVTYLLLIGSAWGSCVAGIADNINPVTVWTMLQHGQLNAPFIAAIIASLTTGYGFDSRFNKASETV